METYGIKEDLVSFGNAELLRKAGFGYECGHYYAGTPNGGSSVWKSETDCDWNHIYGDDELVYSAPTLQMAVKWFHAEHGVLIHPVPVGYDSDKRCVIWTCEIYLVEKDEPYAFDSARKATDVLYYSKEEAVNDAISYALEKNVWRGDAHRARQ